MIHIWIENKTFLTQIQYVFDTIFFILGIHYEYIQNLNDIEENEQTVSILYLSGERKIPELSGTSKNLIFIKDSGKLFGDNYLKTESIPLNIHRYGQPDEDNNIISIYNDGGRLTIDIDKGRNTIRTNMDIISDIFFLLTRYEEVLGAKKDKYDRVPAKESLAYKNNFLNRAIVNEDIDMIWSWIKSISAHYIRKEWWGDQSFAACLSHDVDNIIKNRSFFNALKHTAAILIKTKKLKKAADYFNDYCKNKSEYQKDPYWAFSYIVSKEQKCNMNSSFYFMACGGTDPDRRYDLDDIRVKQLIRELEGYGCEVGYHGSLISYNNEEIMHSEISRLDNVVSQKPYGCRQHYLKFQIPYTWRYQSHLGILYDTTLSFPDKEGFRCGICMPFRPFDLLEGKVLDIWEIPLLVMEGTLQSSMYRNLAPHQGLEKIVELIETVKRHKGVFTLLWHNSSFDYNWEGWEFVFEATLEYLANSNCIGLSGRELIQRMH